MSTEYVYVNNFNCIEKGFELLKESNIHLARIPA